MKTRLKTYLSLWTILLGTPLLVNAQYQSLDPTDPIVFAGNHIVYHGQRIDLGPKAFFIDGQLTDEQAAQSPYIFNSVNEAAGHLTDGTEEAPMVLYLAPYVYWIDDPDDPAVRVPRQGGTPYGLVIDCEWLRFQGLTRDPVNVVMACNRGQTIGAHGNFTLLRIMGQGTRSENVTFGNYCNIDLDYPLKPELSRAKRASAIVQAQLIHCNGDKIVARNTRFVSRLNLCPFVGAKRILFDRCHLESTDDALCGSGVYLNCTLDFHSPKPFYHTGGTGAVFLNCDIRALTHSRQNFTKANGQVAVVDTRFSAEHSPTIGWRDNVPEETRNYQFNVTRNAQSYRIEPDHPANTVDMTGRAILDAYRFEHQGEIIYNTYNLLSGRDDWDPMGIKDQVLAAQKELGRPLTQLPTQLTIRPTRVLIETGKNTMTLTAQVNRFGNIPLSGVFIQWAVASEEPSLVELKPGPNGVTCEVIPRNTHDDTRQVIVTASTPSGLQGASVLQVAPEQLAPPAFIKKPSLLLLGVKGTLTVAYELDMPYEDQSRVTWYRCTDAQGSDPIEVAVSRLDVPMRNYRLSHGDIGYHLMATVAPKHLRCSVGEAVAVVTSGPIQPEDVTANPKVLGTDFLNLSTRHQPRVMPGFWTLNRFDVPVNGNIRRTDPRHDAWTYGPGRNGADQETGLFQAQNGGLFYTPVGNRFGDMSLTMTVAPFKSAGQGFSIAHLYMDVVIKFGAESMTGYGLRLIRTTKSGRAVDGFLIRYDQGEVTPITDPVTIGCYRTPCHITVGLKGNQLTAHVESPSWTKSDPAHPEVLPVLDLGTEITPNTLGGCGIQYAGGASTLVKNFNVEWE